MIETDYEITDDFKARQIYKRTIFYSKAGYTNAKVTEFSADNISHQWRQDVIEFKDSKNKVRLRLHFEPCEIPKQGLPKHTLEIEFFGDEEARKSSKKQLEELTGINF